MARRLKIHGETIRRWFICYEITNWNELFHKGITLRESKLQNVLNQRDSVGFRGFEIV